MLAIGGKMSIQDFLFGKAVEPEPEERRVGFVQEGTNVWRVVYVD